MKTNMNSSSNARNAFGTGLMAAAIVAALAGAASAACPPEETSADEVVVLRGSEGAPARLTLAGTQTALAVVDSNGKTVVSRLRDLPLRDGKAIVSSLPDLPLVSRVFASQPANATRVSRSATYTYKWTGKDAGSNAQEVQAEYKDGVWTVKVDGKDIPADRFTTDNNQLVVKDEAGKEIFRAPVQIEAKDRTAGVRFGLQRLGGNQFGLQVANSSRPRLGVTMNPVDEGIIEHLGLAEGEYAEISSVTPGSAAEEAGLKPKDVVVSIDGRTPASAETISEVIRGKSVGDKVKIRVIRKGQPIEIEATLKKSPAAESAEMQSMPGAMAMPEGQAKLSDLSDRLALLNKDMAERAEKLGSDGALSAEKYKELADKYGKLFERFPGDGPGMKFAVPLGPDGEPRQIEVFTLPGEREKILEDRLKVLEDRLKQMEELLRRLDAKLGGGSMPSAPLAAPTPPTPPSGSGGSATPPRAPRIDAAEFEMLTMPQ